jgi:hypothetical protein
MDTVLSAPRGEPPDTGTTKVSDLPERARDCSDPIMRRRAFKVGASRPPDTNRFRACCGAGSPVRSGIATGHPEPKAGYTIRRCWPAAET